MGYMVIPTKRTEYQREFEVRDLVGQRPDAHLANWASWMRQWEERIGYDRESAVVGDYRASTSLDDMYESKDKNDALITNAVVESLSLMQQTAIKHVYLHSVFRFRGDLNTIFVDAVEAFWSMGQKRGLI